MPKLVSNNKNMHAVAGLVPIAQALTEASRQASNQTNESTGSLRGPMKSVSSKPNLRDQQRVDASLEIAVSRPDGTTVKCQCTNISRAGMMVACDSKLVGDLVPGLRSPAPGEWVEVITRFSVPVVAAQNVQVAAEGLVVHLRRVSKDTFHIGIRFSRFEGNGHDYVSQFVSRQLTSTF
ncbi:PilZ domain-containing protein [Marinobacter salicampi]|uniref:PilZ domain-containing protein n=1 Tax=Marinobacter salicampi TaxID=435907 RepID=UPI001F5F0094|nr:PilZ domain-containing protein [Marinobacter salicampi]